MLDYEDLSDPAICLAYPQRAYPEAVAIPTDRVKAVFDQFRMSSSINVGAPETGAPPRIKDRASCG